MTTPETFAATMDALEQTALRIKAERDTAIALLQESLLYSATGDSRQFKTKVRAFLDRVKK